MSGSDPRLDDGAHPNGAMDAHTPAVPADGGAGPYRFVRDGESLKAFVRHAARAVFIILIVCGIIPAFTFFYLVDSERFSKIAFDLAVAPPVWSLILIGMIFVTESFLHFRAQRVTVDRDGITLEGFLCGRMREHLAWSDIALIRLVASSRHDLIQIMDVLLLIDRFGRRWSLPIVPDHLPVPPPAWKREAMDSGSKASRGKRSRKLPFVGEGHALSLPRSIESFRGPIESAMEKRPPRHHFRRAVPLSRILTGRRGIVCLFLIAASTLAVYLTKIAAADFISVTVWNNNIKLAIFWLAGHGAFSQARRRLRGEADHAGALLLPFACVCTSIALLLPLTIMFPAWFGDRREDDFFLARFDTAEFQYWRSVSAPMSVYVAVPVARANRQYRQADMERKFTVHHGPFGLQSIALRELQPLMRHSP
jgi:hypothetical protein